MKLYILIFKSSNNLITDSNLQQDNIDIIKYCKCFKLLQFITQKFAVIRVKKDYLYSDITER